MIAQLLTRCYSCPMRLFSKVFHYILWIIYEQHNCSIKYNRVIILQGSFTVALSLDPKLVTKEEEKYEEISRFGNIVSALLKAGREMSAKPGTSGTSEL